MIKSQATKLLHYLTIMLIHFYKIPRRGAEILYKRMKKRRDITGNNAQFSLLEFENFDMVHSSIFMVHGCPLSRLGGQHNPMVGLNGAELTESRVLMSCARDLTSSGKLILKKKLMQVTPNSLCVNKPKTLNLTFVKQPFPHPKIQRSKSMHF